MAIRDEYDFELLVNEAEALVLRELEIQLADHSEEICRCNECVVDMAAVALNTVKPLYRFSLLGTLYTSQAMSEQTYAESVKEAVTAAIAKVKDNPSHD